MRSLTKKEKEFGLEQSILPALLTELFVYNTHMSIKHASKQASTDNDDINRSLFWQDNDFLLDSEL